MERSIKMWSSFTLYTAIVSIILFISTIFVSKEFQNSTGGVLVYIGVFILFVIIGLYIFQEAKEVNGLCETAILAESVFGFNTKSIDAEGVVYEDIEKAEKVLREYKEKNNFIWGVDNIYNVLVVHYKDDKKTELVVNEIKNTYKLNYYGQLIEHKHVEKTKDDNEKTTYTYTLESKELKDFDYTYITEIKKLNVGSKYIFYCVKPIQKRIIERHFNVYEPLKLPYIYNIEEREEIEGGNK